MFHMLLCYFLLTNLLLQLPSSFTIPKQFVYGFTMTNIVALMSMKCVEIEIQ